MRGEWSIAAALDRAFNDYPADVLVSVAPGLVPAIRSHARLAGDDGRSGTVARRRRGRRVDRRRQRHRLHAGWDVPNYRWYELEGLRVGTRSTGNDLLIERECSHVSLAAAAVSPAHWRECRDRANGGFDAAGRALSAALAASRRPNRVDPLRPLRPSRPHRPLTTAHRPSSVWTSADRIRVAAAPNATTSDSVWTSAAPHRVPAASNAGVERSEGGGVNGSSTRWVSQRRWISSISSGWMPATRDRDSKWYSTAAGS